MWQEYRQEQEQGQGYGYTQFCYHLSQQLIARKPTMVLNHTMAKNCLPFSDYSFVMAVLSPNIEDFLFALASALAYFGGVPHVLVHDNLKAAIVKANRYAPEINRTLEDFANHYNSTVSSLPLCENLRINRWFPLWQWDSTSKKVKP